MRSATVWLMVSKQDSLSAALVSLGNGVVLAIFLLSNR